MNKMRNGFTLIELLVAMLVFSVIAVTGYHGLQSVLETRNHLDRETRKYQGMAQFFSRLEGQLAQASTRKTHAADGREQLTLAGYSVEVSGLQDAQLLFTRGGGKDAAGGWVTPQRVGYRLRNQSIELLRWTYLDPAPNSKPKVDAVLQGVREFNVRYLSTTLLWDKQWMNAPLPKALEVELILMSGEKVSRVFDLP